jgi:hypothetical protein
VRTWIERVSLSDAFAGRLGPGKQGPPSLDRIKAMKASGWELEMLQVKGKRYVLVLGYRP